MNWGYKIALVYGGFVVFMIALVTLCVKQDDIHLVSKDYYKDEIAYQNVIDQKKNTSKLSKPIQIKQEQKEVVIAFPEDLKGASGEVLFFRPSDARQDVSVDFHLLKETSFAVNTAQLKKGYWNVKMSFKKGDKQFYDEQTLVLQ